eukprot:COSAG02_NODE_6140_length_3774_cov_5.563537_6_plen_86_part_00
MVSNGLAHTRCGDRACGGRRRRQAPLAALAWAPSRSRRTPANFCCLLGIVYHTGILYFDSEFVDLTPSLIVILAPRVIHTPNILP